jgi:hypothetical protein
MSLVTELSVSQETKKHMVTKDVVGLLLDKHYKKHIITKVVVGLPIGEVESTKKNSSLQRMWLAFQ